MYPRIYSLSRNTWLRYERSTTQPRVFYDPKLGDTIELKYKNPNEDYFEFFFNGFDLTNLTIPERYVFAGGPPRDGIPALEDPAFVPISEVDYLEDSDILLSVTVGSETRAYPFRILNWHEVVNDRIGDEAFVVTYCPLCGTGLVFDARVNGINHTFGVSGLLFQNNLLMYDRGSESLWSQFTLESVSGAMIKNRLKWKHSEQVAWSDWRERYPNGKVLSIETGFVRSYEIDPYSDYFGSDGPLFRTTNPIRDDLRAKEWVWGVLIDGQAKAYPLSRLPDSVPVQDRVNGVALELTLDRVARSVSVLDLSTGLPLGNGTGSFWFSWQDFFPETEVYEGVL